MSNFNLETSFEQAEKRLDDRRGSSPRQRKKRSDVGELRIAAEVSAHLLELLSGQERPSMKDVRRQLAEFCAAQGHACPSRATVYQFMARVVPPTYRVADLPGSVVDTLYNLSPEVPVPGHQLAFHCINYGGLRAASFAAGLPWLALYQAARMRGWRPKSRGLLEAVLRVRGI